MSFCPDSAASTRSTSTLPMLLKPRRTRPPGFGRAGGLAQETAVRVVPGVEEGVVQGGLVDDTLGRLGEVGVPVDEVEAVLGVRAPRTGHCCSSWPHGPVGRVRGVAPRMKWTALSERRPPKCPDGGAEVQRTRTLRPSSAASSKSSTSATSWVMSRSRRGRAKGAHIVREPDRTHSSARHSGATERTWTRAGVFPLWPFRALDKTDPAPLRPRPAAACRAGRDRG